MTGGNRMAGRTIGKNMTGTGGVRTSMKPLGRGATRMPGVMHQIGTNFPLHFGVGNLEIPNRINFGGMGTRRSRKF